MSPKDDPPRQGARPGVKPFAIEVSDATLRDLAERLARTRWPDEVAGARWDYGTTRTASL